MHSANKPLQYKIAISSISQHIFNVELEIDSSQYNTLNLTLPTWIPGSYMVRDFAKNILQISAVNEKGDSLAIAQKDKQSWQINSTGNKTIVAYRVYAFDLSIRAAFLDSEFGFANGTSVFLQVEELKDQPAHIVVSQDGAADSWQLYTAMQSEHVDERGFGLYETSNYADLIEHPLLYAEADTISFQVEGIEFTMVLAGGHNADLQRIKTDLEKICQHHLNLFGNDLGITRYMFQTLLSESDFGGLEHTHSTALLFSRNDLPTKAQRDTMPDGYRSFLALCSHELFHTWHVKRIKPQKYLAPDLSKECYSEQLWIYEGFTSYYDDFSLLRSGIISRESYLELLGQTLTRLYRTQGRKVQTVTQSSFETWTKFYKQDENAINGIVSYYIKGAVIALCLDLLIKQSSKQIYSLDSVMRFLWKHYGKNLAGTDDNVIQHVLSDGLGLDLSAFLRNALYTTDELPWQTLLKDFGIQTHFRERSGVKDSGGKPHQSDDNCIDLGIVYASDPSGLLVQQVTNNRAAQQAGLQKGDRLIALNGWELKGKTLESEMAKFEMGHQVPITLFRRGKLKQVTFTIKPAEKDTVYLTIENDELAKAWLG